MSPGSGEMERVTSLPLSGGDNEVKGGGQQSVDMASGASAKEGDWERTPPPPPQSTFLPAASYPFLHLKSKSMHYHILT